MRFLLPPDRGAVRGSARAAVLADWMRDWLGDDVRVELASSYRQLAEDVETGATDLAWMPPAVAARLRDRVHTLLTVVRYGATGCRATLVVRARDGMRGLEDLRGKRASWVDPLSTNGYLMAVAHLRSRGYDERELFESQRFAGSYSTALREVARERADVTSIFVVDDDEGMTRREIVELVGHDADDLALLSTTAPAPFDALAITERVADADDLAHRLLALHQRKNQPAMILEVCRADCFVRADPDRYASFEALVDLTDH